MLNLAKDSRYIAPPEFAALPVKLVLLKYISATFSPSRDIPPPRSPVLFMNLESVKFMQFCPSYKL